MRNIVSYLIKNISGFHFHALKCFWKLPLREINIDMLSTLGCLAGIEIIYSYRDKVVATPLLMRENLSGHRHNSKLTKEKVIKTFLKMNQ